MSEDLNAAVQSLANTEDERRELIRTIASDEGMSPATRLELLTHLYAEEDEQVAEIQAALGSGPTAPRPVGQPKQSNLTVGSLRGTVAPPATGRGTVGSLRRG